MKLAFSFFSLFLLFSHLSNAQVTYAKAEEWNDIKKRTLILQLLEEDADEVASLKKSISKAKKPENREKYQNRLDSHQSLIKTYNDNMYTLIEEHFKYNTKIITKTEEEVKALRKSKNKSYTVLWYSESTLSSGDNFGELTSPEQSLPTLNYSRIEEGTIKVDYSFFIPIIDNNVVTKAELLLSLKLMTNHINTITATGESKYTFKNYVKDERKSNCSKKDGKTVVIVDNAIHKKYTFADLKTTYSAGNLSLKSVKEVNEDILNEKDEIILINIPWGIKENSGFGITIIGNYTAKVMVNVKTGEIYAAHGVANGEALDGVSRSKDFTFYSSCK